MRRRRDGGMDDLIYDTHNAIMMTMKRRLEVRAPGK
jgi:hypothetical protein